MTIPTFHLQDVVDIYDAPSLTDVGIYSGGTTIVAGSCKVALLPLSDEEIATLGGGFDRARVRLLAEPTLDLQAGAKVIVGTSAMYAAGTRFQVEGEPRVFPDPLDTALGFSKEAILVVER